MASLVRSPGQTLVNSLDCHHLHVHVVRGGSGKRPPKDRRAIRMLLPRIIQRMHRLHKIKLSSKKRRMRAMLVKEIVRAGKTP